MCMRPETSFDTQGLLIRSIISLLSVNHAHLCGRVFNGGVRARARERCAHQLGESAENQAECRQICQISESDQLKVVRNHAIGVFWRPVAQLPLGRSAQNLALPAVSRRDVSADVTWRAHRRKAE